MPLVQFKDDQSFGRALGILTYEVKGTFFVRPDRQIMVGAQQYDALKHAGLIDSNGQARQKDDGAKIDR